MRWDYRLNNPSWFISCAAACRRKSLGLDVVVYRSGIYQQIEWNHKQQQHCESRLKAEKVLWQNKIELIFEMIK